MNHFAFLNPTQHRHQSRRPSSRTIAALPGFLTAALLLAACTSSTNAQSTGSYQVLPAIVRGNLAIFPVLSNQSYETSQIITLDEGIRTGQVIVTEAGQDRGLIRPGQPMPPRESGAEVNRLVLYNNSSHALLLLAGEIVTGGKQDRVIGSDRIVPADSGAIDLGVFCVEPHRWVQSSAKFGSMGAQMAQPSIRTSAMVDRNQQQVWANVQTSNAMMASSLPSPDASALRATSSYAKVYESAPVQKKILEYGGKESEQAILQELRNKRAVGVVVAVNGHVLWADVFANNDLLAKYWPKLMRSYLAEAMTTQVAASSADIHDAEAYIESLQGNREVVESEQGVYRRTEITGDHYRVFRLTSLLPKMGFDLHLTKIQQ